VPAVLLQYTIKNINQNHPLRLLRKYGIINTTSTLMEQYPYSQIAPWEKWKLNSENNNGSDGAANAELDPAQKLGFFVLLLFTFLIFALVIFRTQRNLHAPFELVIPEGESNIVLSEEELRTSDTDEDGISDYDEMYLYNTSPYLPDTDSDGILDKDELDEGTDPRCPEGEDCNSLEFISNTSSTLQLNGPGGAFNPLDIFTVAEGQGALPVEHGDVYMFLENPEQIRKALIDTGKVSSEALDGISDEDLLKMAQEFYAGQIDELPPAFDTATSTEDGV